MPAHLHQKAVGYPGLPARNRYRFTLRRRNLYLPQQQHNLLRRRSLLRHVQDPFQASFYQFAWYKKNRAGHAKKELGVESIKDGTKGGWLWRIPNMLKPVEDAHTKYDEHLSAFEEAHMSTFEDDKALIKNSVSTLVAFEHLGGVAPLVAKAEVQ